MERPPQHSKPIFDNWNGYLREKLARGYAIQPLQIEEAIARESDEMYWGRQLDRFALTAANEHLGEVKSYYDP